MGRNHLVCFLCYWGLTISVAEMAMGQTTRLPSNATAAMRYFGGGRAWPTRQPRPRNVLPAAQEA
ncbi:MAG: hypothetical protein MI725_14140, partial [Pirellulales bacterium]|nr:hypothetical protein [Pirellulales bacterium]